MAPKQGKWKIKGFDTFSENYYDLEGEWDDEDGAKEAANERLSELARIDPGAGSLRDKVFVVGPDGTGYRYFGHMSKGS